MVSIKDINKKIKKNLFDPLDKSKKKFSSFLENIKKNKVKKDLAFQKQLEKEIIDYIQKTNPEQKIDEE